QRRDADLELHAVAARLHRAVDHRHALARLPAPAPLLGGRRLSGPPATLRTGGLSVEEETHPIARERGAPAALPAAQSGTGRWALAGRLASGIAFVPVLVLLAQAGGPAFLAFVALEGALGLGGFYRRTRGLGLTPFHPLGL